MTITIASPVLPDPKKCRIGAIREVKTFGKCLISSPIVYSYMIHFAGAYFSKHPKRNDFVHESSYL